MKKSYITALASAGIITGSALFGGMVSAHGGPGHLFGGNPDRRQEVLQADATWLGISTDQLWNELKDKDFKQVAEAHGKSDSDIQAHRQDVVNKLKDDRKQKLTDQFKAKGFNDDQIKQIFEVLDANRPQANQP